MSAEFFGDVMESDHIYRRYNETTIQRHNILKFFIFNEIVVSLCRYVVISFNYIVNNSYINRKGSLGLLIFLKNGIII